MNDVHALLAELGVELAPGGVPIISDFAKAERCYVHHSSVPVAIVAWTPASPAFARGRFPKLRLADLVIKRPSMDGREARALAACCGVPLPAAGDRARFRERLSLVIDRYDLHALFEHVPENPAQDIDVRPRGFDYRDPEWPEIPGAIKAWRQAYKAMPAHRQMMAATIVWLYRTEIDRIWMVRVPWSWHAADAIDLLKSEGVLFDWAQLVALYPGW
jgi:hypothetical protein